jgi:hypothetical protein
MAKLIGAAVLIAMLIYGMNKFQKWDEGRNEGRRDPCVEAKRLRLEAERTEQEIRADIVEAQKGKQTEKLNDEAYRLQVSAEEYARYQETLRNNKTLKTLDEVERQWTASQRAQLEGLTKRAADMDIACQQKSSPR